MNSSPGFDIFQLSWSKVGWTFYGTYCYSGLLVKPCSEVEFVGGMIDSRERCWTVMQMFENAGGSKNAAEIRMASRMFSTVFFGLMLRCGRTNIREIAVYCFAFLLGSFWIEWHSFNKIRSIYITLHMKMFARSCATYYMNWWEILLDHLCKPPKSGILCCNLTDWIRALKGFTF